jgi:undecaprenyl-phosphate galactose phosphotransferase
VIKRLTDIILGIIAAIIIFPIMILCAIAIKLESKGPVFFLQNRSGVNGKLFKIFKLRTMVQNASKVGPVLTQKADPRITKVGAFLRRSSLDELPQLINVIKGEMSLVGPRPIVKAELEKYGDDVGYFLMVRPGMTGLWQVSGRSDLDYDIRVYLDTWYVKNWSLWHDQIILFKTIGVVLRRAGAY